MYIIFSPFDNIRYPSKRESTFKTKAFYGVGGGSLTYNYRLCLRKADKEGEEERKRQGKGDYESDACEV